MARARDNDRFASLTEAAGDVVGDGNGVGAGDIARAGDIAGAGNSGLTPTARRERSGQNSTTQDGVIELDRYWLLTWTTYGTWLPGDDRGFVSNVDFDGDGGRRQNSIGTNQTSRMRGLTISAQAKMLGPPVYLIEAQAYALHQQFNETATFRGWKLLAVAAMRNHVHVVLGVRGDPEPETLLRDLKSYGSRRLNRTWARPQSGTWWTESGSRRKLGDERSIAGAIAYVRDQEFPLCLWIDASWSDELGPRQSNQP